MQIIICEWPKKLTFLFAMNWITAAKKGSNTWNTNSVIFVQYFTFSAVKQLNKYPRPRYILLGTPQPNYSGSELGNQSFVYFTFCCISVELLRRRRINCVYIGGRMFLTARWKSTQCQSFTGNHRIRSRQLYVFCWLIEFKVQIK